MKTGLRAAWKPAETELGPEDAHRAGLLRTMGLLVGLTGGLILVAQLVMWALPAFAAPPIIDLVVDAATMLVGVLIVWLIRSRRVSIAAWVVVAFVLVGSAVTLLLEPRPQADIVGSLGLLTTVALAFALLSRHGAWLVFGAAIVFLVTARAIWIGGALPEPIPRDPSSFAQFTTIAWVVSAVIVAAVLQSIVQALRRQARTLRERLVELRRTEQALRESEQKLQQIVQGTQALVMNVDARGRITYVNEAARRTLGYSSEEMIGRFYLRYVHPDDRRSVNQTYSEQVETRQHSTSLEFRVVTRDGDVRWVNFMAHPITEQGRVVEVTGFAMDVSDRRRAEQALRQSEQRLQQIVHGTQALLINVDPQGRITYVNEPAQRTFERTSEEMVGGSYLRYVHPEDRNLVDTLYEQQIEAGTPSASLEFRIVTATDEVRWVNFVTHLVAHHGEVAEVAAFGLDVTARKQAEEALRESESRYRRIFQTAGVPIWEEDFSAVQAAIADLRAQGVDDFHAYVDEHPGFVSEAARMIEVRDVNRATLKMLGAKDKEAVYGSLDQIFTAETEEIFREEIIAIAEGKTYFEGETVNRTLAGERRNVLLTMAIPTQPEEMDSVLISTMDITERKRAEEALRRRADELAALQATVLDITARRDLPSLLQIIVERAAELLDAPGGGLYLCNADREEVRCVVSYNTPRDYTGTVLAYGEDAAGTVAETGEPLVIDDYRTWSGRASVFEEEAPFSAVLSAPMTWQGQVTGVVHVFHDCETRSFTESDLTLLALFANHAAIAVENTRLLHQVQQELVERRRAEEALAESRRQLATLMGNLPGMAYRCDNDPNWTMEFVSGGCRPLTGYEPEELVGDATHPYAELILDEDRQYVWDGVQEALADRRPFELTYRIVSADGEEKWVWEQGQGLFDDEGNVVALEGFITDITERKRAERALRESEARYRRIFRTVPVPLWEEDFSAVWAAIDELKAQGVSDFRAYVDEHPEFVAEAARMIKVRDVNQATLKMVQAEKKEDVLDGLDRIFVAESEVLFREELIAIAEGRSYFRGEGVNGTLEGEHRDILVTMTIPAEPKALDSVLVSTLDITERKRAERALRESEERLQVAASNLDGILYVLDTDLRFQLSKGRRLDALELEQDQVVGMTLYDFFDTEDPDHPMIAKHRRVLAGETVQLEVERDGVVFSTVVSPIRNFGGEIVGAVGLSLDITERKQLREQLRQQERLAAVGQLAGGIAHDFNNILASIILYAQMPLGRSELTPRTRRSLETILEESHRAADLVDQILDFSRRAMMETEPLSLVDVVEDALELLQRTIPEDIQLTTQMGPCPCTVQADPTRLHQVLMNLVVNARDAMPHGGVLDIRVHGIEFGPDDEPPIPELAPGKWACLSVSDNGIGMTPEVQEHLFEPFFTTKEEGQGTGLGLAQVYGIVKQHEGHIDVHTDVDEGSTFTIYLPLDEAQQESKEPQAEAPPMEGYGETILVVEDAERILQAIQVGLESLNYRVLTATTGREALETVPLEEVDLVLTDVVMPEMGGRELLNELHARAPGLKVIAMTGYVMDTDADELQNAGFVDMLPKPFSIEELTAIVRDALATDGG